MTVPTDQEQLLLELINETRLDPMGAASRYISTYDPLHSPDTSIQSALTYFNVSGSALLSAFNALTPTQPLAWNSKLADAALGHSQLMIDFDLQSHQLTGEAGLGTRITNAGYSFSIVGENIYAFAESILYAHAGFMVDWGYGPGGMQDPAGHRENIMDGIFREVGLGVINEANPLTNVGPLVVTEDIATRWNGPQVFLLGVVYVDSNGDDFYSVGEGSSSITVSVSGVTGLTTSSGGYALELSAGSKTISFSGAGFSVPLVVSADLADGTNAKLDVVNHSVIRTSVSLTVVSGVTHVMTLGTMNLNLTGSNGNETLDGNSGNNLLSGYAGSDALSGDLGNDTLDGGVGSDALAGGGGTDAITYAGAGSGVTANLSAGFGAGGDAQGDTYSSIENVIGSSYADVLVGLAGVVNSLSGGGGDDTFYGEGIDSVDGGDGNDVFFGGQGSALNLNLNTASLETVWGSYVGDTMNGASATANLVLVGQGLTGGGNADTMTGGSGNDFFYYRAGDVIDGGTGSDWAVATLSASGVVLDLSSTHIENSWGSSYDDTLTAAGSASTVVLVGDTGNDSLTGGNTTDYLYGFDGNDVLTGGAGGDVLVGGAGNDIFVYASRTGSGFDSIFDFTSGVDQVQLTASEYGMTAGGTLVATTSFISGVSPTAVIAAPTFLYSNTTGILAFDLDGTGSAYASVSIAQLFGAPIMTASDFLLV